MDTNKASASAPDPAPNASAEELQRHAAALKAQFEELRASDDAQHRLFELLGQVTAQKTSDDICRTVVEGVRRYLGFERAGLFLYDQEIGWFRGTYGTDLNGTTTDEHKLIMDDQPSGCVRRILSGANIQRGCELGEPPARPGEEDVKADLIALKLRGQLFGVLSVDNRISHRPITDTQLEHIALLSQILGNALETTRAQGALSESEERFRQVARNSGEWIWELDRTGCFTYSSPVVGDLLGYTPQELEGKPYINFVADEDKPLITSELSRAMENRETLSNLIHRQIHRTGRKMTLTMSGMPSVDAYGALRGFRGANRDVTREQELEAQLRHSQKMEVIGRLAGGVAHDFNNLLTSVLGYSTLLLEQIEAESPLRGDLDQIRIAGERAAGLTRQLLAFSRKQVFRTEPMNINGLVQDLEKLLRRTLGEDIELVTRLEPRLRLVKADADPMQQVLLQLAINARDAMVQGRVAGRAKQLTIETANTRVDGPVRHQHGEVPVGEYVTLTVADAGSGMSERVKEHLFEPFFTTKGVGQGSGLGLSTVYGIVRQLNGSIQVESAEGHGTTFRIYLPCCDAEAPKAAAGAGPETLTGTGTILIVEDEETVRRLTVRMLRSLGYSTLEAGDGAEALQICRNYAQPIDLILTDMIMPHMSGKEFVEALRKMRADFKVLFVSGYSSDDTVGGDVVGLDVPLIKKPFTREGLARRVKEVIGNGRPAAKP